MSKLVDRLKQASDGGAAPIGFKSAALPKQLPLALIGEISLPFEFKEPPRSLDAVLVKMARLPAEPGEWNKVKTSLGTIPWGIAAGSLSEKNLVQLKEASCDFAVLTPQETGAAALLEEDLGKVVMVDPSWTDATLRSLESLPVDAVLAENVAEKTALTLQSLMELRRLSMLTGKALIVRLSYFPPEKELAALLRVQARGLLFSIKSAKDVAEIGKLRTVIENLPRPKPGKSPGSPLIPAVTGRLAENEDEDEDEE
ncbi:MAG: hypothetical protein HY673_16835 [Chloroflexi bacterium]|nr:hypothetical protein [Chloroflexota bacterium]